MELKFRDGRPIYVQLMDRLRQQILTGVLSEGERLPSVRELAGTLAINPNTIQRAYRELESEGWIASIPGKGTFVCNRSEPGTARRAQLLGQLEDLVAELEASGMTREELAAYLRK